MTPMSRFKTLPLTGEVSAKPTEEEVAMAGAPPPLRATSPFGERV